MVSSFHCILKYQISMIQTDIDLLSVSEVVDLPPAIGSRDGCIVG